MAKAQNTERRKRRGYVYRHGAGYSVRWVVGGKTFVRALRDSENRPIRAKRDADAAAARVLADFTLKDEAECVQALITRMKGVKEEIEQAEAERNPGTSLLAGWTAYRKAENRPRTGDATLRQYTYQYETFRAWMEKNYPEATRLNQVTRDMVRAFVAWLESEGRSPNTVNKHLNLFNLVWRILAEPGKIEVNPWTKDVIARRRLTNGTGRRELSIPELKGVANKAKGELRSLLAIGIFTGLRLGDACRLDWAEVDLARGVIVTSPHKTADTSGTLVAIPIAPALRIVLEEIPQSRRTGPILPEMSVRYESKQRRLVEEIQDHFKACGIKTTEPIPGRKRPRVVAGFHSLRHSFISHAAMAGWPEALVRAIVGHTSSAVTRRYIHTSVEAVKGLRELPDPLALTERTGGENEREHEPLPPWAEKIVKGMTGKTWHRDREALLAHAANTNRTW